MIKKKQISSITLLHERVRVMAFLVAGMLAGLITSFAIILYLPADYQDLKKLSFPICVLVFYIASILSKKPNTITTLYDELEHKGNKIQPVVTVMYLNYLSFKYSRISIFLILTSITFTSSLFLANINNYIISTNLIT
jgi:uncharacterized membrane protein YfcA